LRTVNFVIVIPARCVRNSIYVEDDRICLSL
jgi:hypothetical protein